MRGGQLEADVEMMIQSSGGASQCAGVGSRLLVVTAKGARRPQRTVSTQLPPFVPLAITACALTPHPTVSVSAPRRVAICR